MPPAPRQQLPIPFRGPRSRDPNLLRNSAPTNPPETVNNDFPTYLFASAAPMLAPQDEEHDPVLDSSTDSDSDQAQLEDARRRLVRYQQKLQAIEHRIRYLEERVSCQPFCFDHSDSSLWSIVEVHSEDISDIAPEIGYQLMAELILEAADDLRHEFFRKNPAYKACMDRFGLQD
ncbi:hypothetical protein OC861_006976 [Tilletia horrida]|nr:hypothetical protein OC861_006976 [Tilletia horrida]